MEPEEGHLWTESFLRLISHSSDTKRLRALQQIILHGQGEPTPQVSVKMSKPLNKKGKMNNSINTSTENSVNSKNVCEVDKAVPKNSTFKSYMYPIMGKWALLAKCNNDAEIISKIVMEKFKSILNSHRQKKHTLIIRDANFDSTIKNPEESTDAKTDFMQINKDEQEPIYDHIGAAEDRLLSPEMRDNDLQTDPSEDLSKKEKSDFDSYFEDLKYMMSVHQSTKTEDYGSTKGENDETAEVEDVEEYDAHKFLESALGSAFNEICSSLSTLNEENQPPPPTTTVPPLSNNDSSGSVSIDTNQISSLYKASMYLKKLISRKSYPFIESHPSTPMLSTPVSYEELFTDVQETDTETSSLVHEAAAQNQIIIQTCKALNFCANSKQFQCSMEYVEAEKILLLATLKYDAVRKELHKAERSDVEDLGTITISHINFPLEKPTEDGSAQWYIVTVSCGAIVLSTELFKIQDTAIKVEKPFTFTNLDVDFEITVSLYTLTLKNQIPTEFQSKQETLLCPMQSKFCSKSAKRGNISYERRNSCFILWGCTTLQISDIPKTGLFKLCHVPNGTNLKGTVGFDLSSNVKIVSSYSGFLDVASEAGGSIAWNRRWCVLNGFNLLFWNYPAEQELVKPFRTIDLRFCVTSRITQVDRELCARPRTLLLETGRLSTPKDINSLMSLCMSSYTIIRHYLSAESQKEMREWQQHLNHVVSTLRNWNNMECQLYFSK